MRVASPCHVGWDSMDGSDRARFCRSCERNVYNIVGLSRDEIESLVQTTEGRLCVRMYQRADETVLTQDCPVGFRAVRKRVATLAGAALSALLGLVSVGYGQKPDPCSYPSPKPERVKIDSKNGQIFGSLVDMMGAAVAGIEINLHLEKRLVAATTSDADGSFTMADIKPAENYVLTTGGPPWKKHIIQAITVNSGEKVTVNVCLEVGNIEVVVGLFYDAPEPLSTEPTKPTETFIRRQTRPLPITPKDRSKLMPIPQQPDKKPN